MKIVKGEQNCIGWDEFESSEKGIECYYPSSEGLKNFDWNSGSFAITSWKYSRRSPERILGGILDELRGNCIRTQRCKKPDRNSGRIPGKSLEEFWVKSWKNSKQSSEKKLWVNSWDFDWNPGKKYWLNSEKISGQMLAEFRVEFKTHSFCISKKPSRKNPGKISKRIFKIFQEDYSSYSKWNSESIQEQVEFWKNSKCNSGRILSIILEVF